MMFLPAETFLMEEKMIVGSKLTAEKVGTMKKVLILAIGVLFIPFTVFGMQAMTEAEMDLIRAQYGTIPETDYASRINHYPDNEASRHVTTNPSATIQNGPSMQVNSSTSAGIAILIDDLKIFFSGGGEIWYQTSNYSG